MSRFKAVVYKLPSPPDPERPNFIWSYRCDCGYEGGFSASRKNAQKGVNGHGNYHRPAPEPDGVAADGTVSFNLHRG